MKFNVDCEILLNIFSLLNLKLAALSFQRVASIQNIYCQIINYSITQLPIKIQINLNLKVFCPTRIAPGFQS